MDRRGILWFYTGKQDPTAGLGRAQIVVLDLADGLLECRQAVVVDNFFTNISLAESLLQNDTYRIGTLKSNRARSGHGVVQKKLKRGDIYGVQSNDGIQLIKWKDKRDVLMITTKLSQLATLLDTGKTNKANQRTMKPSVVLDYKKGKQGIDLSDQLSAYYTCLRRSKKWYHKVAFETIFGVSIVNAYFIYKEYYGTNIMPKLQFYESLVRSLLLGVPFANVKPDPRERSTSQTKRKLTDHELDQMEESGCDVQRRCPGCYAKI